MWISSTSVTSPGEDGSAVRFFSYYVAQNGTQMRRSSTRRESAARSTNSAVNLPALSCGVMARLPVGIAALPRGLQLSSDRHNCSRVQKEDIVRRYVFSRSQFSDSHSTSTVLFFALLGSSQERWPIGRGPARHGGDGCRPFRCCYGNLLS